MKASNLRFLALGGVIAPVIFTFTVLICAALRPGYNHIVEFISGLGATGTPYANLMNFGGFIPTGILNAILGLSLMLLLPKNYVARFGSFFIILFGLGMMSAGIFSADGPGGPPGGSFQDTMHGYASFPAFFSPIIGMLLLGIAFRRFPSWKGLWIYSVASAVLAAVFVYAMINSIEAFRFTGLWQRLLLGTILLWCGIVGMRLFKIYEPNAQLKI